MLVSTGILLLALAVATAAALLLAALAHSYRCRIKALQKVADTDVLTGLYNRAKLNQELEPKFADAGHLSLVYIDIADFQDTNERFGHRAGDVVLKHVANRLLALAPSGAVVARVGGDEFCVALSNVTEESTSAFFAQLNVPIKVDAEGRTVRSYLNCGVAVQDEEISSPDELFRRADRAMSAAKAQGGGPVYYAQELDEALRVEREVREELSTALTNGELELHYQPIINARTGEIVAAEALTRWPGKIGPAGSPANFIPIAEETGLIIELGDWALESVLKEIKAQGDLAISLNVSPRQFLNPHYAQHVGDQIIKYGVAPELLKIEITEGVLIDHADTALRILRQLREIGVQILLDDFGTGYSSLSYLQKFQFDSIKIDRSFVRVMNKVGTGADMLKSIVNLGHSLGMSVIAEGVELPQQSAALQLLGCDYLQGYGISVPINAEKLSAFRLKVAQSCENHNSPDLEGPRIKTV